MKNLIIKSGQSINGTAKSMAEKANKYLLEFESTEFNDLISKIESEAKKGKYSYIPKERVSELVQNKLRLLDFYISEVQDESTRGTLTSISWRHK